MSSARPTNRPLRVAIIGGGIGGLFTALSLSHHCQASKTLVLGINVYEQAAEFKEIGAGIGLGVNATRLFHKIGLGERLNSVAGYRNGYWISFRRFDNSAEILTVAVDDSKAVRQAPTARSDLLDILRDAIEERDAAVLHTRKQCLHVENVLRYSREPNVIAPYQYLLLSHQSVFESSSGTNVEECADMLMRSPDQDAEVKLHFADSTSVTADIVIAADGIHSNIRNQFIQDKPVYAGQIAYRAVIPIEKLSNWPFPTYSVAWLAKHRHMLVFPISQNKSLNVVAFVSAREEDVTDTKESWTSVCDRSDIERDFAGFDEVVQQIIQMMQERPSKWRLNDREPLDQWHFFDGKVVLLGDAAHAMLPHMGAGAGQSIEDAWVLGRALGEYMRCSDLERLGSLADCASHYQAVRKQRAQKVQRSSREAGDTYELQTTAMVNKSFEESIPIMAEMTRNRMRFLWEEELDEAYEKAKSSNRQ